MDYWSLDWLPTTSEDQSCAFCGRFEVEWVHPLDRARLTYRVYGKEHTLPTFWTLCDPCERRYGAGEDEAIIELMKASHGWSWTSDADVGEVLRQPLAVFRAADQGARPLPAP